MILNFIHTTKVLQNIKKKQKKIVKKFSIIVSSCESAEPYDLIERARTDTTLPKKFETATNETTTNETATNQTATNTSGNEISRTYMIEYQGKIYALHASFKLYPIGSIIPKVSDVLYDKDGMITCYDPAQENTYSICSQWISIWEEHLLGSRRPKTCLVVGYGKDVGGKQQKLTAKVEKAKNDATKNLPTKPDGLTPILFAHESIERNFEPTDCIVEELVKHLVFHHENRKDFLDFNPRNDSSSDSSPDSSSDY